MGSYQIEGDFTSVSGSVHFSFTVFYDLNNFATSITNTNIVYAGIGDASGTLSLSVPGSASNGGSGLNDNYISVLSPYFSLNGFGFVDTSNILEVGDITYNMYSNTSEDNFIYDSATSTQNSLGVIVTACLLDNTYIRVLENSIEKDIIIKDIKIGDKIVCDFNGKIREVKSIRKSYCTHDTLPIKISKGTLNCNKDLYLTSSHAVLHGSDWKPSNKIGTPVCIYNLSEIGYEITPSENDEYTYPNILYYHIELNRLENESRRDCTLIANGIIVESFSYEKII